MNNKPLIITLIIILTLIIIFLLAFMISSITGHSFIKNNSELLIEEEYDNNDLDDIIASLISYDLDIIPTNSDKIKVEIYGNKKDKDKFKVKRDGNTLKVEEESRFYFFHFSFGPSIEKVTIRVPEKEIKNYDLTSVSGDIYIKVECNSNSKVKTTSGDIDAINLEDAEVKSVSGDIKIEDINKGNVKTTSGNIEINSSKDLDISSISGDISINKLVGYISGSTTSGEIDINRFTLEEESTLESTSGDIEISLLNEANIKAHSTSGDINIKDTNGNIKLNLKTISGDIKVK